MARRRKKEGASISLVPILSIQKCAMGIMVVIICAQTTLSVGQTTLEQFDQYLEIVGSAKDREPVFVECKENGIMIHTPPQGQEVTLAALKGKGPSPFHHLLDELEKAKTGKNKKHLVLLVRPEGIPAYQNCIRMARWERKLDVGKDAVLSGGSIVLTRDGKPMLKKGRS